MNTIRRGSLVGLLLVLTAPAWAQKPKIDPEQRYLLLATSATATMQMELDEAAAQGFRVVMGSARGNTEMVLLLERAAQPPNAYKYRLLATTDTVTMQKELGTAAQEGFRVVARTLMPKPQFFVGPEIVVLLERPPRPDQRYEYLLVATTLTSTLQKEWAEAATRGFVPVGMATRGELILILERKAPAKE